METDMEKAKKWAAETEHYRHPMSDGIAAAARVIQALPDLIVDGDGLKRVIRELRGEGTYVGDNIADDLETLLTPPAPTLVDVYDPAVDYRWMAVSIKGREDITEGALGYIASIDGRAKTARIFFPDGSYLDETVWHTVIPHPDRPRLQWPDIEWTGE